MMFLVFLLLSSLQLSKSAETCEVCTTFFIRVLGPLTESELSDSEIIKETINSYCQNAKGKEFRFCDAIGALPNSPTTMMGTISTTAAFLPYDRLCLKLSEQNDLICSLKYDKPIDLSDVDLNKLTIRELRKILNRWNAEDTCQQCPEKSDYVRAVIRQMAKYDPTSWQKRVEKQGEF